MKRMVPSYFRKKDGLAEIVLKIDWKKAECKTRKLFFFTGNRKVERVLLRPRENGRTKKKKMKSESKFFFKPPNISRARWVKCWVSVKICHWIGKPSVVRECVLGDLTLPTGRPKESDKMGDFNAANQHLHGNHNYFATWWQCYR